MVNTFVIGSKLKYLQYLDDKRLGKQRVEAKQLIDILEYYDEHGVMPDQGWTNHKATKMWIGHTKALKVYFNKTVELWISRGFKNNYDFYEVDDCEIIKCKFDGKKAEFEKEANSDTFPIWFSFPPFHYSHRAALYMKNPEYYESFRTKKVIPYIGMGYFWPSDHSNEVYENWNMSYLAEPGEGLPSHYRISRSDAEKWVENKLINPKSGRSIVEGKKMYKDYEKAAMFYGLV